MVRILGLVLIVIGMIGGNVHAQTEQEQAEVLGTLADLGLQAADTLLDEFTAKRSIYDGKLEALPGKRAAACSRLAAQGKTEAEINTILFGADTTKSGAILLFNSAWSKKTSAATKWYEGNELKEDGDAFFSNNQFGSAITKYLAAIEKANESAALCIEAIELIDEAILILDFVALSYDNAGAPPGGPLE